MSGPDDLPRTMPRVTMMIAPPSLPFERPWQGRGLFGQALSEREIQVLAEVAQGRNNGEVAGALDISEQTVKNHMTRIMSKLGVPDRTSAVVVGIHRGIIEIEGLTADRDRAADHIAMLVEDRCNALDAKLTAIDRETASLRERVTALRAVGSI